MAAAGAENIEIEPTPIYIKVIDSLIILGLEQYSKVHVTFSNKLAEGYKIDDIKYFDKILHLLDTVLGDEKYDKDSLFETDVILVYKLDEKRIAACMSAKLDPSSNTVTLSNFAVHPFEQSTDISTKLLYPAIAYITSSLGKSISLHASNIRDEWEATLGTRIQFYASLGFRVIPGQMIEFLQIEEYPDTENSGTMKTIATRQSGIVHTHTDPYSMILKIRIQSQEYPIQVSTDLIIASPGTGIHMICPIAASAATTYSILGKIGKIVGNPVKNEKDFTLYHVPPSVQYTIACHGTLKTKDTFEIPDNIELITLGHIGSPANTRLFTNIIPFIEQFKTTSIDAIQSVFPPLKYSLRNPSEWRFPPYMTNISSPGLKTARLLSSDFLSRRIIEIPEFGMPFPAILFYINALKPGDLFYDMQLDPLTELDIEFLGKPDHTYIPYTGGSTTLSVVLNSISKLIKDGGKARIYLYACHSTDRESQQLIKRDYDIIKSLSVATPVDSVHMFEYYIPSLRKMERVDEDLKRYRSGAAAGAGGIGGARRRRTLRKKRHAISRSH